MLTIPEVPAPSLPDAMRAIVEAQPGRWVVTDPGRSVYETNAETLVIVEPGQPRCVVNVLSVLSAPIDERISPFLPIDSACERLRYALEVAS